MNNYFHSRCVLLALCAFVFFADSDAAEVINSVHKIRLLTSDEAAQRRPVFLDAQVMRTNPRHHGFFVGSDNESSFVRRRGDQNALQQVAVGDWIRICGKTGAGEFSPEIDAEEIVLLTSGPLPTARAFELADLLDPASEGDWVSVSGRLTSMAVPQGLQYSEIMLTLELQGAVSIVVQVPLSDAAIQRLPELMFRRVRFNALLGTVYNGRRQMAARSFLVYSVDDFEVLAEGNAAQGLQDLPIHKLLQCEMDPIREVRTRGTVTYVGQQEIFLRGEELSLKAVVQDVRTLKVGQTVELEGFVWPQPVSPAFRARVVRVVEGAVSILEPIEVPLKELFENANVYGLFDSRLNYELVKTKVQLVDVGKSFGLSLHAPNQSGQWSLLCRSGDHLFEARLPAGVKVDAQLKPGAIVELTGICNLIEEKRLFARLSFKGLWLQVRSSADIVVLNPAPWWNHQRFLWVSGAAIGFSVLFLVWVLALRRTVDRQTGLIREKIGRESILNERQRIARELHDTLEQGLTALSFQLRNIYRKVEKDPASAPQSVLLAESMLRICQEESRASIVELRGGILEEIDLESAIRHTLKSLIQETGIQLTVVGSGAPVRLVLSAEHHILRMITEAANNAIQHAYPKTLCVELCYGSTELECIVRDDGCGFLVTSLPVKGHFGVSGMGERVKRLRGTLTIESELGRGTTLSFRIPVAEFLKENRYG